MRGVNHVLGEIVSKCPTSQEKNIVHETHSLLTGLDQIWSNVPTSLIQKVLSFEVGSRFQSKSSENIFMLASCSLPLVILVGMFTFPLACGLFIMGLFRL